MTRKKNLRRINLQLTLDLNLPKDEEEYIDDLVALIFQKALDTDYQIYLKYQLSHFFAGDEVLQGVKISALDI